MKKEYILCSAIKRITPRPHSIYYTNDINDIEIGYRHCDIFCRFQKEVSRQPEDQGFYTSHGRFVDRKEGMKIAHEVNQVDDSIAFDSNGSYNILFSEDIY